MVDEEFPGYLMSMGLNNSKRRRKATEPLWHFFADLPKLIWTDSILNFLSLPLLSVTLNSFISIRDSEVRFFESGSTEKQRK